MKKLIDEYLKKIIILVFITDIIALILMIYYFKQSLGWILGSIASLGNLIWLSISVKENIQKNEKQSQVSSLKSFYMRYPALILYSIAIVYFLKPSILFFGGGLLSGQIAIYILEYKNIFKS